MTIKTRPLCPYCGKRWTVPLEIPEFMLRQTLAFIRRNGGLSCGECEERLTQLWARIVMPAQTYIQ